MVQNYFRKSNACSLVTGSSRKHQTCKKFKSFMFFGTPCTVQLFGLPVQSSFGTPCPSSLGLGFALESSFLGIPV